MINGIINDKLENIEENKLFPFENAFNYNKHYKCIKQINSRYWLHKKDNFCSISVILHMARNYKKFMTIASKEIM